MKGQLLKLKVVSKKERKITRPEIVPQHLEDLFLVFITDNKKAVDGLLKLCRRSLQPSLSLVQNSSNRTHSALQV